MTLLDTLHLLKAETLPSNVKQFRQYMTPRTAKALRMAVGTGPSTPDDEALGALDAALLVLGDPGDPVTYTAAEHAALPEDRYEEHDAFFNAVRVGGNPVQAYTRTLLEACSAQLR